jgi:chloramphenicol-sensitive protein RarD
MQFALGVLVYHEAMPPMRWAGFGLVWLALAIMTSDALAYRRRTLALAATAPAADLASATRRPGTERTHLTSTNG